MKKTSGRKLKSKNIESHGNGDRKENIHRIRKEIENILLEREHKKLWEL